MTACCKELYCAWKTVHQGQRQIERWRIREREKKRQVTNSSLHPVVVTGIITVVLISSNNYDVIAGVWLMIVMVTFLWRRWVSPRQRQLLLITRSLIPKNLQRWSWVHSVNPSWSSIHDTFHPTFSSFLQPEISCSSQPFFLLLFVWHPSSSAHFLASLCPFVHSWMSSSSFYSWFLLCIKYHLR